MLADSAIVAPAPQTARRLFSRQLGGCLLLDSLQKINPLPLLDREQSITGRGTEILDNDAAFLNQHLLILPAYQMRLHQPDEEGENDYATKEVKDQKVDCVPLRDVQLRLLISPNNVHDRCHHIDPAFQRHDLEED